MKFEQLLSHFDTGICIDQLQKESLLDLALLFIGVDGKIDDSEKRVVYEWANQLQWNSTIALEDYFEDSLSKSVLAVQQNDIESFIQHRMHHIVDEPMRKFVKELVIKVIEADGVVDDAEKRALAVLEAEL